MNIVHCILSLNTGGAETLLIDIINEQSKANKVSLIIINNSFEPSLLRKISKNVSIYLLKRRPKSRNLIPIIKFNILLFKISPNIIHLHHASISQIIFTKSSKIIYTSHAIGTNIPNNNKITKIIAISNAVKDDLKNRNIKIPIVVIPNGIPITQIKCRVNYELHTPFKIIQIARLYHAIKGQDILIKAIAELKTKGVNNISVDFIGAGASESFLKDLANKLNVKKQINFLGIKDRDYIYAHLCEYDLMCHPSRSEGFGLTVAEGMAANIPILVSNGDGPFELIQHGKYGYFFTKDNITDCANQIYQIITNYDKTVTFCKLAYEHVNATYSVTQTALKYIQLYKDLQ